MLMVDDVERLRDDAAVDRVRVRTTLTCDAVQGVCAACYGLSPRHPPAGRARRGGRRHRRPVHRRAGHPADHADLPLRWRDRERHHPRPAARGRALRGPHAQGRRQGRRALGRRARRADRARAQGHGRRQRGRGPGGVDLDRAPPARRGRPGGRGRHAAARRPARPQADDEVPGHPRDPAVPGRGGPERLPRPGRVDPRQAHRADRAPDDAPRPDRRRRRVAVAARRDGRREAVQRHQRRPRGRAARRRPTAAPS